MNTLKAQLNAVLGQIRVSNLNKPEPKPVYKFVPSVNEAGAKLARRKLALLRRGEYTCPTLEVVPHHWKEVDWVKFIDSNGQWNKPLTFA